MTVDVQIAGQTRRVTARRCGNGWAVQMNGREFYVDVAASRGRWSFLIRATCAAGAPVPEEAGHDERGPVAAVAPGASAPGEEAGYYESYEVAVETRVPGEQVFYVNGQAVPVSVADPRTLFGRRGHESSSAAGPARVTAPMPGRIVKVLVQPGDSAAAGQPLVVVEAMKMENELRAPRGGTVSEVRVAEGMSIEANTVLIVLQ